MKQTFVLASNNAGKLREVKEILSDYRILSLQDLALSIEVEEDGNTFEENALKKATAIARLCSYPVIADDSGLEVACLQGAPGIYSARFAGLHATDDQNNQKLLADMEKASDRSAQFVAAIAVCFPDGEQLTVRGVCSGEILRQPRGTDGFGYDPLFFVTEENLTFAEMSPERKNRISHRAKALQLLKRRLEEREKAL